MSTADQGNEQVLSEDNWGPFWPLKAIKAIRKLGLTRDAQHIAIMLAIKTDKTGEIEITHRELVRDTGRSKTAVPKAMAECVKVGLLYQRHLGKKNCFKYTWGRVAYFPTDVAAVGRHGQISCSESSAALRDALWRRVVPEYLPLLKIKHGILPDSPKVPDLIRLSEFQRKEILDNLEYGAKYLGADNIVSRCLTKWFQSDGKNGGNFLLRELHPLSRFSEDVSLLVCNLISFEEHKQRRGLTEQTHTIKRVEHRVTARPDVQQITAESAKNVVAAIGAPRQLQRLEFKRAANA